MNAILLSPHSAAQSASQSVASKAEEKYKRMAAQDPGLPPTPQEWLTPANSTYPAGAYSAEPTPAAAMFELRPLTLSEVLDRTFTLYRSRFWLFAGIAAFSGAVQAVSAAIQMLVQGRILRSVVPGVGGVAGGAGLFNGVVGPLISLVGTLLFFLAFSVTSAATAFAVGETYLGRLTTVKESFQATVGRWYAYIAIGIWQACSMIWLPLLLFVPAFALIAFRVTAFAVLGGLLAVGAMGGFVVGYILYLRNAFGIPAAVTERLKIRAAMRRSKVLAAGTKGRIFVLHLIALALYMVVGVLQAPLAFFVAMSVMRHQTQSYGLQAVVLVIGFVGHTVVSPVAMIGLVLLYIDQRVRKEAFDIAVLLGDEQALAAGAPPVNTTPEAIEAAALSNDTGATAAGFNAYSGEQRNNEADSGDAPLV